VMSFIALLMHRRLRIFSIHKQIPQVALLLLSAQLVMLLTGILINANLPEWDFLLASVSGALLWPLLPTLVRIPQRRRPDSDAL
jgi:rod shape-determining protein MreD